MVYSSKSFGDYFFPVRLSKSSYCFLALQMLCCCCNWSWCSCWWFKL